MKATYNGHLIVHPEHGRPTFILWTTSMPIVEKCLRIDAKYVERWCWTVFILVVRAPICHKAITQILRFLCFIAIVPVTSNLYAPDDTEQQDQKCVFLNEESLSMDRNSYCKCVCSLPVFIKIVLLGKTNGVGIILTSARRLERILVCYAK